MFRVFLEFLYEESQQQPKIQVVTTVYSVFVFSDYTIQNIHYADMFVTFLLFLAND